MNSVPSDIAITLDKIKQEFMRLNLHWRVYSQIFRGPELQIEMLNTTAPAAFVSIESALRTEIIMSLSRLTDKAETGPKNRNKNLTFDRLQKQIENGNEQSLLVKLSNKLDQIDQGCKPVRKLRDKQLAHIDYEIETERVQGPNAITIQQVEEAIRAMQDYLDTCQHYYNPQNPIRYDHGEEGELLVRFVRDGFRIHELIHREGKLSHLELEQGKYHDVLKKRPKDSPNEKIFPRRR